MIFVINICVVIILSYVCICCGHANIYCVCTRFWFNPKLLEFIDTSKETTEAGDFVLVVDSYKKVKALQDEDHGGWTKKMQKVHVCNSC